jgi:hypothetical protein
MKIREGAYYRTRHGDVVGPMRLTNDHSWFSCFHTWNEDGGIFSSGAEHGLDLISEVYVSDTPPADAPLPEVKTLRDEFAVAIVAAFLSRPLSDNDLTLGQCQIVWDNADAMMKARKK